jgi:hypothetical protein
VHKRSRNLSIAGTVGFIVLTATLPARAVDIVPFAGFRFGGIVGTQQTSTTAGPKSVSLDASLSYGGVIDIPVSDPYAVELYYSRQPTKLSSDTAVPNRDVTMSVLHLGVVDTVSTDTEQLSWLLIGSVGATQLSASGGGSETRPSIGIGGGVVWMATDHFGVRGDLRALLTFSGGGGSTVNCGGGCVASFHGNLVAQGEASIGIVARF